MKSVGLLVDCFKVRELSVDGTNDFGSNVGRPCALCISRVGQNGQAERVRAGTIVLGQLAQVPGTGGCGGRADRGRGLAE